MKSFVALSVAIGLVAAQAPPAPVLLTATKSGVLPVIPTATPGAAFTGVETIEGAITYDGPANPGFTGLNGNASVQQNTAGLSFQATLPTTNFDDLTGSTITGSITLTVPANGTGVIVSPNFSGFPSEAEYGPFVYHIHALPVPADGNCTSTLGHLDPTDRGEYYPCAPTAPETCQAGDLAGKHGNITGTTFSTSYLDLFLSTDPSSPYYFGDKSIVIHSTNTTRLTCANFVQSSNSTAGAIPAPVPYGNSTTTASAAAGGVGAATGTATITAAATAATGTAAGATGLVPVSQITDGQIQATSASAPAATVAPYTGGASKMVVEGVVGAAALIAGALLI